MCFYKCYKSRSFRVEKLNLKNLIKKERQLANATIVCGVSIGKFSLVGAGAVITKDVKAFSIMVGNPAKKIGWISTNGNKLDENLKCPETGEEFIMDGEILRKK